ncbi:MAG: hypothetical protein IRZ33_07745 [Alicyclobacillaceae bacterium]|nr:hypothetical protein [Alicyclobacillaceae bacterium]
MFQCPACGELLEALTHVHCRSRHQLSKDELVARYGQPKYVAPQMSREIQRWIRESQIITRLDFEMAQASVRNQFRRRY